MTARSCALCFPGQSLETNAPEKVLTIGHAERRPAPIAKPIDTRHTTSPRTCPPAMWRTGRRNSWRAFSQAASLAHEAGLATFRTGLGRRKLTTHKPSSTAIPPAHTTSTRQSILDDSRAIGLNGWVVNARVHDDIRRSTGIFLLARCDGGRNLTMRTVAFWTGSGHLSRGFWKRPFTVLGRRSVTAGAGQLGDQDSPKELGTTVKLHGGHD